MALRILVVCTANVCRSPMAAALLARHCAAAGVDVQVASAGTEGGRLPVDPEAVRVMAEHGLDIAGHRSRRLDRAMVEVEGEHLVIAMTRDHVRTVATMASGAFRRTFTAKELARRIAALEVVTLDALNEGRSARDLMGKDARDDVADPYGRSLDEHRACAAVLDDAMRLVAAAFAGGRG